MKGNNMEKEELELTRNKITTLQDAVLDLIEDKKQGAALINELVSFVAKTATDVAIKSSMNAFIEQVKKAAEEGKAQVEADE